MERNNTALTGIKMMIADGIVTQEAAEKYFPELKESEDEKILRVLKEGFEIYNKGEWYGGITNEQILAWLEKQGEQKPDESRGMNLVEEKMTPFQREVFGIIDLDIENEQGLKQVCDKLLTLASNEIKRKSAEWSEDDEGICRAIINDIANDKSMCTFDISKGICDEQIKWLKSLKERVACEANCTTTKEWSEEDEAMIKETLYFLREYQQSNRCKDENGMQNSVTCENWLKSLKNRITWKPSEEQMKALRWILNHIPYDSHKEEISGLLEQLKKLREE